MSYNSKRTGVEVETLLNKAETALQSVPSEYVTEGVLNEGLEGKVDKVSGKQLSTEDFTTALKTKLEGMNSFDPTEINNKINGLQTQVDTLVNGDASAAIESFNEIINFLNGIEDTESLEGIIAGIERQITTKQDTIADLDTIRSGAALGATALQRIDYPQLEDNLIDSGFYHSPDGMLYRSDMEDAVQESLNKADSALQAENDPIFSASPAASITTERMQEWDNKAGKVVNHESSDTNVELTPYVTHKWGTISSLTLTFSESTESEYNVVFEANDADFVLSIPQNIRWANSQIPQFEAKKQYEINIKGERALYAVFDAPYIEGTFLEYIENDGVDYILTDIYITKSMSGMRCKSMILTTPSSNVALAGTRNTASGTDTAPFIMWYLTSGRYLYWNGVRISGFGSFEPNVAYTDEYSGDAVSLDCSYPIAIFGVNNQGRVQSGSAFRLYYLELLDSNGNPIVNLCPFKRTYDNAIGLLDKVSGTFYPSNNGNLIGG